MTERPERGSDSVSQEAGRSPRSFARLIALALCGAVLFAGFAALGTWQLYRLQWKLALIERVEQRVHAAPVPAPGPERWPHITAEGDEYRHVRLTGAFLHELSTKVQASTELGSGYWVITPLRTANGSVVLVNRGFIPLKGPNPDGRAADDGKRATHEHPGQAQTVVTGLLRISEPGGGFLRRNDPAGDRWYSRDVEAIARARGLSQVAPYFVDADAAKGPADGNSAAGAADSPVGGLTVISFHNNHLGYALTWYALALMVALACAWVVRDERRLLRHGADAANRTD
jgi:surfeit locus 1 family protein